jgi:antitoxin VapB
VRRAGQTQRLLASRHQRGRKLPDLLVAAAAEARGASTLRGRIFPAIFILPMPLNIKDPQTDSLVRELAQSTGETITQAVEVAVSERLERLRAGRPGLQLADELDRIALRCAALPLLDTRSDDEILGYDERGLPS